jgi:hypothetical protein
MNSLKIDVLAFGAHPDDVELSCSGLLLLERAAGRTTGIIDLTRGELGSRGTAESRDKEAVAAAAILGVSVRENLELADGFFQNDKENQLAVIKMIRKYRPDVVLCNAPEDRHPDHGRGASLVKEAAFLSGLSKIITEDNGRTQEAWRPAYVFHYIQDRFLEPDFVIDITSVFDKKMKSVMAYESQFYKEGSEGPATYISTPEFMHNHIGRLRQFGRMIGTEYGEGFISEKKPGFYDLGSFLKNKT